MPVLKPGDYKTETQIDKEYERPGLQKEMQNPVITDMLPNDEDTFYVSYKSSNCLESKVAFITGGDSGIGAAVATLFAKEGADVAINYLPVEQDDADEVKSRIEGLGRKCLQIPGDIKDENVCKDLVEKVIKEYGRIDILVNNAAEQHFCSDITQMDGESIVSTFHTNIISMFYLTKYAVPFMGPGSSIINTTSVVAYRGSGDLLDYGATKGAIVSFTRCLAKHLANKKIRVNAVAPGPVVSPLQPISRDEESMEKFANEPGNLIGRVAQPAETATSYVFLASNNASQFTGQTLHPNSGEVYNA